MSKKIATLTEASRTDADFLNAIFYVNYLHD